MNTFKTQLPLFQLKKLQSEFPKIKVTTSKDSADFIRQFYGDDLEVFESFFILMLNQANNTIGYAKISQGGIAGTVVDIRIILKYAVESLATSVIISHNHPSGNLKPSRQDEEITQKIKSAFALLDIRLLDHVIITSESYLSFGDEGIL